MTAYEKATMIADKLRNIRLDVIITAVDILVKCRNADELNFYYHMLIGKEISE